MDPAHQYMVAIDRDPEEAKQIAEQTARKLESKEIKLLDLTKSLGEFLTDDDRLVRAKSIGFYSSVLAALEPSTLTHSQVSVITQFLCDRLQDEAGLKETAQGLLAVQKMNRIQNDDVLSIAKALFSGVELRKHPQSTRFIVYQIVDNMMGTHREVLKSMGKPFVRGYVELVTGEKDPRNLMIVFSNIKVIFVEFDIVDSADIVFEAVYCYFPITFRPPPDDPYGITAQDLKQRLKECLSASRYFAPYMFNQLLEKINSPSIPAKKDILQVIAASALNYGPTTMSIYASTLWDSVKFEVLNAVEDEVADEALEAIKAIAVSLSFGLNTVPKGSPLGKYLSAVLDECIKQLKQPTHKQARPASRILASVASSSVAAHNHIASQAFPKLFNIYEEDSATAKQRALMQAFNDLLDSTLAVYGGWDSTEPRVEVENGLVHFKDRLFESYSRALMGTAKDEVSFRQAAMTGLMKLSKIRDLLAENEVGMIAQFFGEIILKENSDGLRTSALQSLVEIGKLKPNLIMEITFPAFMAELPEVDDGEDRFSGGRKNYTPTLYALAQLSLERSVFEVLLTRLLNKVNVILKNGSTPAYAHAILSTILYVLRQKADTNKSELPSYFDRIVPELLTRTIVPLADVREANCMAHDAILEVTGSIFNLIVRYMEPTEQEKVLKEFFNVFVNKITSPLILTSQVMVETWFAPLRAGAPPMQATSIVLLTYVVAGMKKEVPLPVKDKHHFLDDVVITSQFPVTPTHKRALLRLVALLVNKWMSDAEDRNFLSKLTEKLWNSLSLDPEIRPEQAPNLPTLFWITKALVLKSDELADGLIDNLITLLKSEHLGELASRGFEVLLQDDEVISKENHAVVRLLAKQKFFTMTHPKLVAGFREASTAAKANYLVALSNIICNVPSNIVLSELQTLLPLLLQSLDLSNPEVKAATIDTLLVTVMDSSSVVEEHISSLIARLLTACSLREENPPKVRIAALKCLKMFPMALKNEKILPYKRRILRSLQIPLDDPKRAVRKEAVECRAKWFTMDEPDEE